MLSLLILADIILFQDNLFYCLTKKQGEFECAAFSSAYVLRYFGMESEGFDLYDKIPGKFKMTGGTVYPKGIGYCLAAHGVKSQYCRGNL